MFCIHCGISLTQENQRGLVCQACKEELHTLKAAITVTYCFTCGKPYRPLNMSIKHLNCQTGEEGHDRATETGYSAW
jgi:predicted amidophosphoribosyltransferase